MKPLNVAVIGCGAIHDIHLQAIQQQPHAHLRWVVDCDLAKARASAQRYGCDASADFSAVLSQVDVVHLCTPHYLHAEMAITALNAGKHVFTEKPLGTSLTQVHALLDSAARSSAQLGLCLQNRYNSTSVMAKQLIEQGCLGQITALRSNLSWHRAAEYYQRSDWRGDKRKEGGGVLINQAIHQLDLMLWLCGNPERVKAQLDNRLHNAVSEVEDSASATLIMQNGALWQLSASTCFAFDDDISFSIYGEQGSLHMSGRELWLTNASGKHPVAHDDAGDVAGKGYWGTGHSLAIQDFYHALQHDQRNGFIRGQDGLAVSELLHALYLSAARQQWVSLAELGASTHSGFSSPDSLY